MQRRVKTLQGAAGSIRCSDAISTAGTHIHLDGLCLLASLSDTYMTTTTRADNLTLRSLRPDYNKILLKQFDKTDTNPTLIFSPNLSINHILTILISILTNLGCCVSQQQR